MVWILARNPGAFTMFGLQEPKTVLMLDAEDDDHHDGARISFPELIQMYMVMQVPLTTVDPYGWNAEMLAARNRRSRHAQKLQDAVEWTWYHDYNEVFQSFFSTRHSLGTAVSQAYVWGCLHSFVLAGVGTLLFLLVLLLLAPVCCKCNYCIRLILPKCAMELGGTILLADIVFRVLWLLTINTAFLQLPPLVTLAFQETSYHTVWNPLPVTTWIIFGMTLLSTCSWGCYDYKAASKWKVLEGGEDSSDESHEDVKDDSDENHDGHDESDDKECQPEDRYQDPMCHFLGCFCIFLLMSMLIGIYIHTILKPLEMDPEKIWLWWGSLLVQVGIPEKPRNESCGLSGCPRKVSSRIS